MSTNQKFQEAKNKLVSEASNHATRYLLGRYGSAHLIGEPIVELTSQVNPISNAVEFSGVIKVQAAPTGLLNQVGVNMTVNSNDIEVESENIQSDITEALNAQSDHSDVVVASLDSFKLHDDGSKYYKVSHSALQDANLGIVGKNEWTASPDKSELLRGMVKDAMLENNISFVGEFKEPTIKKEASDKKLCPHCKKRVDSKDGKILPHESKYFTECGSSSEKESALIVDKQTASKKSWLTADMLDSDPMPEMTYVTIRENPEFSEAIGLISEMEDATVSDQKAVIDQLINFGLNSMAHEIEKMVPQEYEDFIVNNVEDIHTESNLSIKEDMPMARVTDHLAQMAQLEEQLLSASSAKIQTEASNALLSMLQGMGYGSAKIAEVTSSKDGLDFMAAIDDGGSVKAVSIPVAIKEAKVVLPKKSLVSTLISKGLDVRAKLSEQFDLDVLEKLAAIEEKIAYEAKEANDILADRPATAVVKEAAGEKQPFFDSDDSTMTLNKHLLPDHEDYKVGDILSDGTDEYEIVNTSGQQNDKNEGSSSQWTLKKRQAPLRDDKEPKNKMPS